MKADARRERPAALRGRVVFEGVADRVGGAVEQQQHAVGLVDLPAAPGGAGRARPGRAPPRARRSLLAERLRQPGAVDDVGEQQCTDLAHDGIVAPDGRWRRRSLHWTSGRKHRACAAIPFVPGANLWHARPAPGGADGGDDPGRDSRAGDRCSTSPWPSPWSPSPSPTSCRRTGRGLGEAGFSVAPIVHLHGALFFTWTLFFLAQTLLVATGRVQDHRAWGLAGISLATAMGISVVLTSIDSMQSPTASAWATRDGISIVALSALVLFGKFITLAIANVRHSEAHRRYMMLAVVPLLHAAMARVFMTLFAPPGSVDRRPSSCRRAARALRRPLHRRGDGRRLEDPWPTAPDLRRRRRLHRRGAVADRAHRHDSRVAGDRQPHPGAGRLTRGAASGRRQLR